MCLYYIKKEKEEDIWNLADSQIPFCLIPSHFPIPHFYMPISISMEN